MMKNKILKKRNIQVYILIYTTILLASNISIAQIKQPEAEFHIASKCMDHVELINLTENETDATNYLWTVYQNGNLIYQTVTKNPIFAFEKSDPITIKLLAFVLNGENTISTEKIETDVTLYSKPNLEISSTNILLCSNTFGAVYHAPEQNDYIYNWDLPDEKYYRAVNGLGTNMIIVDWHEVEDVTQLTIFLTVESEIVDTSLFFCSNTFSIDVILTPAKVPEPIEFFRKHPESNVLICTIEDEHLYSFNWLVRSKAENDEIIFDTLIHDRNFYEFNLIDTEKFIYQAKIVNRDFSYCYTTLIYDSTNDKSTFDKMSYNLPLLSVYPNPNKNGLITIRIDDLNLHNVNIWMRNSSGREILRKYYDKIHAGSELIIQIPEKRPGLYILEVTSDNHSRFVKKIISL